MSRRRYGHGCAPSFASLREKSGALLIRHRGVVHDDAAKVDIAGCSRRKGGQPGLRNGDKTAPGFGLVVVLHAVGVLRVDEGEERRVWR